MVRSVRFCALLLLLLTLAGCLRREPVLTLAGSTSVQPLAELLAEAYRQEGGRRVRIQGGGSSAGILAVRSGIAAIGASSRMLTPEEAAGLHVRLLAWDALAVVVHPDNPVTGLSSQEIRRIFAGILRRWPDGVPIRLFTREHGSGTRAALAEFVGPAGAIDRRAIVLNSSGAIRAAVAADPAAIGCVSLGSLADGGVRVLPVDGVPPAPDDVRSGRYPLRRPFLLLTGAENDFTRFAAGPKARAIIRAEGLVPP
jgi:phosphate transport system substrate-binding protein